MSIQTHYAGIEFRSRLEARWAAFFTAIGWEWTYEPFDGNGYIPDFLIHGEQPLIVEVKPAVTERDYREPWSKIRNGLHEHWQGGIFIAGASPLPVHEVFKTFAGYASVGKRAPSDAHWIMDNDRIRLWGHGQYASLDATVWPIAIDLQQLYATDRETLLQMFSDLRVKIKTLWAHACNEVKWRG